MRIGLAIAVLLALAGCGDEKKTAQPTINVSPRAAQCTQRILDRVSGDNGPKARAYIERVYCVPFDRKGWVYADGTLSIAAHLYVVNSGACQVASSTPAGPTTTNGATLPTCWIRSSAPSCTTSGKTRSGRTSGS